MEKKPQNKFTRAFLSGFTLALIGTLCIIAVLGAQLKTQDRIKKIQADKMMAKFSLLVPPEAQSDKTVFKCHVLNDKLVGKNMHLYTASIDNEIKGYIMTYSTSRGYSNPLILIGGFDKDKNVYRTDIHFSMETPGLGDKVDRKHGNFMDMLSGKNAENAKWDVKKFNGDFDYITGSTVTSRAVVLATKDALDVLNKTDISKLKECE